MSWIDLIPVVLIVGYAVLGYFSGAVRRLIGLVALYLAFWAATSMGLQAGGILQQSSNMEVSDGRIFGFFGIAIGVLIIVEVATQLAHAQIQIPALSLNHSLGVLAGLLTAVLLSIVLVVELQAAANPFGGPQLDQLQQHIRDAVNSSHLAVPFAKTLNGPVIDIFRPVLPSDPQIYFGPGPVN
ncbi:MAG TPA: CvpA family protein [Patescibacteria group bacterium]|nr:CvpA family protein [Patescibacteria group bacterium]